MQVIRASRAGFCMGVSLALKKLEKALQENAESSPRICTLGPIIHNPQVLADFAARGVNCLDHPASAETGDVVLIRAHGIPLPEELLLRQRCAAVMDATCPRVKNAQTAIARATSHGAGLLLFGELEHPEVRGLISYASNAAYVFASLEELLEIGPNPARQWVLASQTTQDREIFDTIAENLRERLPDLKILSTICDATRERQEEALKLARNVDIMVVAGGRDSGNTRRLANLARQSGIDTFHVETVSELDPAAFAGKLRAGLTAGASTPKSIIDDIEKWLENI